MDAAVGINDAVSVAINGKPAVKGPDPGVWGDEHCRGSVIDGHKVKGPLTPSERRLMKMTCLTCESRKPCLEHERADEWAVPEPLEPWQQPKPPRAGDPET